MDNCPQDPDMEEEKKGWVIREHDGKTIDLL